MIHAHCSLLLVVVVVLVLGQASAVVYLENCTYALDLYKEYLNVLWSSDDSRTIDIQAIYSLSANESSLPGQIYTYSSQSLALIPLFVRCASPNELAGRPFLPFAQCSSAITNFSTKKNYESSRTHLNIKSMLGMTNVPLLYIGEHYLILSNCSFQWNSSVYRLQSSEVFSFRVVYESAMSSPCVSCNRRTSVCHEKTCQCRAGAIPLKLHQDRQFCIDITRDCSLDARRCLYSDSVKADRFNELALILAVSIGLVVVLFLSLLWYLLRRKRDQHRKEFSSNQSIFTIDQYERTPSTISTTDSIRFALDHEYPKIIGEDNNGETIFILA